MGWMGLEATKRSFPRWRRSRAWSGVRVGLGAEAHTMAAHRVTTIRVRVRTRFIATLLYNVDAITTVLLCFAAISPDRPLPLRRRR